MAEQLTEAQIAEFKEVFELFDLENTGFCAASDLGHIMRGLGMVVSEDELGKIVNHVKQDDGRVPFPDFLNVMAHKMTDPTGGPEKVIESFRVFDSTKSGMVDLKTVRDVMMKMGEPLTAKEIDAILVEAPADENGMCNYEAFVNQLTESYMLFQ